MDNNKNTVAFFVSMFAILMFFSWWNSPSEEQLEAMKRAQDSIAAEQARIAKEAAGSPASRTELTSEVLSDSALNAVLTADYGVFASSMVGNESEVSLENEFLKVDFSTKGGFVKAATLKKYEKYGGGNIVLNTEDNSSFSVCLPSASRHDIETSSLYFTVSEKSDTSLSLSVKTSNGGELTYKYMLPKDDYMMSMSIETKGLSSVLKTNNAVKLNWNQKIIPQEKGKKFENRYTTIYYKEYEDDVEYLSESSNDEFTADSDEPIKWVAFKDQFFSSILIADNKMNNAKLVSNLPANEKESEYLKSFSASLDIPFVTGSDSKADFHLYFGPNKYSQLRGYDDKLNDDLDLNRILTLGWGIFRWVNQFIIIPLFNGLGSLFSNYGLIIFLMTVIIKTCISPLTYKSYLSSAKMRVLKPQIEEINARIPEDKPMERQQEMMSLYSKAGVNPMGGCLPMLLQMPFLFALFSFFPASIELRGQSFLWAEDLASYDAIVSWDAEIPILSSTFGNHISLFCLLMTVTNVIYTYFNFKLQDTGQAQMKGMKYMMMFMPIMFMFIFNDYASGLSYYYFISLLITILQTFVIRKTIDENKLLEQIKANQQKPQSKSSWISRLEEMRRMQEEQLRMQQQGKK